MSYFSHTGYNYVHNGVVVMVLYPIWDGKKRRHEGTELIAEISRILPGSLVLRLIKGEA